MLHDQALVINPFPASKRMLDYFALSKASSRRLMLRPIFYRPRPEQGTKTEKVQDPRNLKEQIAVPCLHEIWGVK